MRSDRSALERQIERVELRPFTLEGFHRRRQRKDRNRRIGAAVVTLALVAGTIGALARALTSDREAVPADQPSGGFVGTWTSTDLDFPGSSHSMTISPAEDGALHIVLHDKSSRLCSDTPSTGTGTGRLQDATTLEVSSFQVCPSGDALDVGPSTVEERATSYTLVLDVATDRLFDNLGVAWHRGATPQNRAGIGAECEVEEWGSTPPGTCSMLGGEVTFHADRPWKSGNDSLDPRLFYLPGPEDASIEILANANPLPEGPCYLYPRLPAPAEALAQSIRSNPDVEATVPVVERVGGIDALRLDVAPVPGASTCPNGGVPVVSTSNGGWGTMGRGDLGRLYILDLPGGSARTLAIMITAPEAAFERAVEAAAPVVDSFQFHTADTTVASPTPPSEPTPSPTIQAWTGEQLAGVWLQTRGADSAPHVVLTFTREGTVVMEADGDASGGVEGTYEVQGRTITFTDPERGCQLMKWTSGSAAGPVPVLEFTVTDTGGGGCTAPSGFDVEGTRLEFLRISPRSSETDLWEMGSEIRGSSGPAPQAPSLRLLAGIWSQDDGEHVLRISPGGEYTIGVGEASLTDPADTGTISFGDGGTIEFTSGPESRTCPEGAVMTWRHVRVSRDAIPATGLDAEGEPCGGLPGGPTSWHNLIRY